MLRSRLLYALLGIALAAGSYGVHLLSAKRAEMPRYPLPADDPRCPSAMAFIPEGTVWVSLETSTEYWLESDAPPDPGASPVGASLAAFCLDRNEVTVNDYVACIQSGRCPPPRPPRKLDDLDEHCNEGRPGRGYHPMNCVDWHEAESYCLAQGKRLPREAEWQYAAEGAGARNRYPWGDRPGHEGHECVTGAHGGTCPVRSFPPESVMGLFDMAGNVTEPVEPSCERSHYCQLREKPLNMPFAGAVWDWTPLGGTEEFFRSNVMGISCDKCRSSRSGIRCAASPRR